MMWYFSRLVRLLSGQDLFLFQRLYELVHNSKTEVISNTIDYGQMFHARAMLPGNQQLLSRLSEYDLSSEELQEREQGVFSHVEMDRLAIARKLTLMSEMNLGFVGDRRLWLWLEDALRDTV